eukprot:CAMPEP_0115325916 /NCGR_PEP_ID=MMETSP0270-20121206/83282_1 /TAXON_ID=71861 /ORGANISM="Scrippsiella trochoidea, Strain CCMP3099" /LENGTH=64 /DNA_ID=CAMNT_0002746163 /DNA_START=376 /DNA_END=567 /DNA_ORIENTATION=-
MPPKAWNSRASLPGVASDELSRQRPPKRWAAANASRSPPNSSSDTIAEFKSSPAAPLLPAGIAA